jgi:hypothetical protein
VNKNDDEEYTNQEDISGSELNGWQVVERECSNPPDDELCSGKTDWFLSITAAAISQSSALREQIIVACPREKSKYYC